MGGGLNSYFPEAPKGLQEYQPDNMLDDYQKAASTAATQAQTTGIDQQNQQRALALKDDQTLRSLSPQYLKKSPDGTSNGFDFGGFINAASNAGVSPATLTQLQQTHASSVKDLASADEATRTNEQQKNKATYDLLEGIRGVNDPAQRQQIFAAGLPTLRNQGVDVSKFSPNAPLDDDSLSHYEAELGMHGQILADAKTKADTAEAFGKASAEQTAAALNQIKLNLQRNSRPGDLDSNIDQLIPPSGPNRDLNNQTKVLVNAALQRGDFEGAQRALDQAGTALTSQRANQVSQNREDIRAALGRQATNSNDLQRNGLTQLDHMFADPHSGYSQFISQANSTKATVADAQNGSELAASLTPLMTALGVTSFAGVHRINGTEVNSAGPQVGSLYRQLKALLDKAGDGSIPPETAAETNRLIDRLIDAKHQSVVQGATVIARNNGLDPTKTTVMDRDGSVGTLDDVSKRSAQRASQGAGTTSFQVPAGAPSAQGLSDGHKLKDANGNVIAISLGGKWAAPPSQ